MNIEAQKKMILDNRRITIKEIAGSSQAIFTAVVVMKSGYRSGDVDNVQ